MLPNEAPNLLTRSGNGALTPNAQHRFAVLNAGFERQLRAAAQIRRNRENPRRLYTPHVPLRPRAAIGPPCSAHRAPARHRPLLPPPPSRPPPPAPPPGRPPPPARGPAGAGGDADEHPPEPRSLP